MHAKNKKSNDQVRFASLNLLCHEFPIVLAAVVTVLLASEEAAALVLAEAEAAIPYRANLHCLVYVLHVMPSVAAPGLCP